MSRKVFVDPSEVTIKRVKVYGGYYVFGAFWKGRQVGCVIAQKCYYDIRATYNMHSEIWNKKNLNKGFGILMYTAAINFVLSLRAKPTSSMNFSSDAARVWRSKRLRKLFKIKHDGRRFVVEGKLEMKNK